MMVMTQIPNKCKNIKYIKRSYKTRASTGNRTRAARVAGEHSTTEPSMLTLILDQTIECIILLENPISDSPKDRNLAIVDAANRLYYR